MNIAFFTNYIYTPHYETELELIQLHLDKGDTVYHFVCDAHLLSCDFNPYHDLLKCATCITKRGKGQKLLENKKNYHEIKISKFDYKGKYHDLKLKFGSIKELRAYKIGNFEIGDAALSSLVSIAREPDPDLQYYEVMLSNIILSSNYIYQYFLKELPDFKIDLFYNFNGRFAVNRAVMRAAQNLGIFCYIHERGNDFKTYELFENVLPHEIMPFTDRTIAFWENHSETEENKIRIAHDFYKDRVKGKEQGWLSFITEQKKGLLPENWNSADDNIVIFTSSEDEYVSIGEEWELGVFVSQNALIVKLMNDARLSGKKIWVRLHPNMRSMTKKYLDNVYETLQGDIGLIVPESPVNSYDLVHAASKVITFGSTVGIEATYWGKTSILVGPGFYQHFKVTYNPETYEDLVTLILTKDLEVLPQENTLQYGFYLNNFGIPFKIFKPKNLFEGTYKGVNLDKALDYDKWEPWTIKRGFHWFYHRFNRLNYKILRDKYV
jgi:hypothetical protein